MGQDGSDASAKFEETPEGFVTRIRFGKGKRARFVIALKRRADAAKRDRAMRESRRDARQSRAQHSRPAHP